MAYDFFRVVDYSLVPDSAGAGRWRADLDSSVSMKSCPTTWLSRLTGIDLSCQLKVSWRARRAVR